MRRRPRLGRVAKWAALVVCAVLAPVYVLSVWKAFRLYVPLANHIVVCGFEGGAIVFGVVSDTTSPRFFQWFPDHTSVGSYYPFGGWAYPGNPHFHWIPEYKHIPGWAHGLWIPIWMLLAAFGPTTAFLWYTERYRISSGHCKKCGYDLTGNMSGRCPECGAAVKGKSNAHT